MKKRQQLILDCLHEDTYTTALSIGETLNVTDRTVRSEMKQLADELEKYGAELVSKPKYGYRIQVKDRERFNQLIHHQEEVSLPDTPQQRVQFILEYLLAHDEYVKIEELCDLLYLSQSSISQDLKLVREILEKNNLKLIQRPHYGIKIEGNEFDLRLCISNYLSGMVKGISSAQLSERSQNEKISAMLEDLFDEENFHMSDFWVNNLVMHISIAIERIKSGNYVPMEEMMLADISRSSVYVLAQRIAKQIEKEFNVKVPMSECGYISIHLLGKRTIQPAEDANLIVDEEMYATVDAMLRAADEEMNLELSQDLNLRLMLALHLIPLKSRLQYALNMRNPLLKEIKSHYMLAFVIATAACVPLKELYQKEISEDEVGYIALHINLALERSRKTIDKKNIVMVCSTGRGTAELLEYQYREKFGKYIDKLITCDVMNVGKVDFTDIDFVISTVPIQVKLPVPIIRVQYFMESNDEHKVKKLLSGSTKSSIEKYFDPNLFLVNVPAKSKEEVIDYMTFKIRNFKKVPRNFKELVMLREKKAVTEFGNLIAIPHPYRVCTQETFVCVALLKQPIVWDKQKVQLVFMLSVEKNKNRDLQKFYMLSGKMLTNKEYIRTILHEKRYETMMGIFRAIEWE